MKRRYLYFPLAAGVLTPSAVIFFLQVFVAKMSPFKSVIDILNKQFAPGHNLFILMVWSFIPFGALIVLANILKARVESRRLSCIFWGGFIAVLGYTVYSHIDVWYPLYAGKDSSSTAVLAFLIIPIFSLFLLLAGSFFGWIVSLLPWFRKR